MNSLEIQAIISLGTVFFLRMIGIFILLPVFSHYGMSLYGSNQILIGLSIGIYGLMQAIFQIPLGLLSDRIGQRLVIIIGLLIFSIGSMVAVFINNIWGIILGRALQGSCAISSIIIALLSNLVRKKNQTKAMSFIGIIFALSFSIALVLGPVLADKIGINGLFILIFLLSITNIVLMILVVPKNKLYSSEKDLFCFKKLIKEVLYDSQIKKINFSIFSLHFILTSNFIIFPNKIMNIGFPISKQWIIYLIAITISLFLIFPLIFYSKYKIKIRYLLIILIILLLFSELFFLILSENLFFLFLGIQMFFFSFNAMETLLPSLIGRLISVNCKGTAMSIYSTSQFLGTTFGGIITGYLYQIKEIQLIFLFCFFLTCFWLSIIIKMNEINLNKSKN